MELAEYPNDAKRAATARVMARLSLFQTMAPPDDILEEEIEQSLHDRFGRPTHPTKVVKFGVGVGFAFGEPLNLRLSAELLLLVGPQRALIGQVPGYDPYAARRQANLAASKPPSHDHQLDHRDRDIRQAKGRDRRSSADVRHEGVSHSHPHQGRIWHGQLASRRQG